jgi:small neutral amino acid transporter SnatA (MarC family)
VAVGWQTFLDTALLFVVLINPASKVALLVALAEQHRPEDLARVAWRASVVGLLLLAVFAAAGGWVLRYLRLLAVQFRASLQTSMQYRIDFLEIGRASCRERV